MNLDVLSLGERIRLVARLAAIEHIRQEIAGQPDPGDQEHGRADDISGTDPAWVTEDPHPPEATFAPPARERPAA
jgi:hypothetical protein